MKRNRDIFFAQDKTATVAVVGRLKELMLRNPELSWAAVVDGAFDYPADEPLPYALTGKNCFEGAAFEGLEKAAPWLVPISPDEQGEQFLMTLVRHCSGRPMLSFVATRTTLASLNTAWTNLHWVMDEDGQRMLLRFTDTRILPSLPQVLTPQQWAAYTGFLSYWLFIDREGKLSESLMANNDSIRENEVVISQRQMNALLQYAEPDAVIDMLKETMSDIIPDKLANSHLFVFVNETCLIARKYDVETFSDVFSMVTASFITAGKSNTNQDMIALLRSKAWRGGELNDAILAANIIEDGGM